MIMKSLPKLMMGALPMLISGCMLLNVAEVVSYEIRTAGEKKTYEKSSEEWLQYVEQRDAIYEHMKRTYEKTREWWQRYGEQRDLIYSHMRRYGINRDDVAAMGRLSRTIGHSSGTIPPYSTDPHVMINVGDLLNPGEHYRMEMDEFILTMRVPNTGRSMGSRIWPYTNTRTPDPVTGKFLESPDGGLKVFNSAWYIDTLSLFLGGRSQVWGVNANYSIRKPKDALEKNYSPESWLQRVKERSKNSKDLLMGPELVTINGRYWTHTMWESVGFNLSYSYVTVLSPDRTLSISFSMPYDYKTHPDKPSYRDAFKQIQEIIASIRVSKIDDDDSPDPFVIERVEPAPLPVREKLPTSPLSFRFSNK
ncbi:hypothetical protein FACS189475_00140 [Betaproteobacteria bacterium]|nr:hypothetical protein FACS189475_00140 [Betaproteobacteria bacterium]